MTAPVPTRYWEVDQALADDRMQRIRDRAEAAADRIGAKRYWISVRRGGLLREARDRGINVAQVERYGSSLSGLLSRQDDDAIRCVRFYDHLEGILDGRAGGMSEFKGTPGPFGAALDALARQAGNWSNDQMAYAIEVIGKGHDPQILILGSTADWMPRAKRWRFTGHPVVKSVVSLSKYRAAIAKATGESA